MSKKKHSISYPSDEEILITRNFQASRERMFKVYTDPAHIPQWWGPRNHTTTVDMMDVRPGGKWRFVCTDEKGQGHAFRGEYEEISPPGKLVYTFEYENMPGHILTETIMFEEDEDDGGTLMVDHLSFATKEDRDGMLASGMESGAVQSMDRLEELLRTLS